MFFRVSCSAVPLLFATYNFPEPILQLQEEVPVAFHQYFRIVFLLLLCSASVAQNPTPVNPTDMNPPVTDSDEVRARMAHDMEEKAAKERVAALKNDTDKLLKLSVELKSYVDKSDENVLSLTVIKKAEEIEKLAKSVKDKMKGPN
jgi:hypothetical protein